MRNIVCDAIFVLFYRLLREYLFKFAKAIEEWSYIISLKVLLITRNIILPSAVAFFLMSQQANEKFSTKIKALMLSIFPFRWNWLLFCGDSTICGKWCADFGQHTSSCRVPLLPLPLPSISWLYCCFISVVFSKAYHKTTPIRTQSQLLLSIAIYEALMPQTPHSLLPIDDVSP